MALNYEVISGRISAERFAPYLSLVNGDMTAAVRLYERNAEVSGAWWEVIAIVEILLRNAMNEELMAFSAARHGDCHWYTCMAGVWAPQTRQIIAAAQARAVRDGRPPSIGEVVTELSFGFWRNLLTAGYERKLWRTCLYKAFPGEGRRRVAHDAVLKLHRLRNRIAHHEPIHNRPLGNLHGVALRVAEWVCRDTATWIQVRSRVPELLVRVA